MLLLRCEDEEPPPCEEPAALLLAPFPGRGSLDEPAPPLRLPASVPSSDPLASGELSGVSSMSLLIEKGVRQHGHGFCVLEAPWRSAIDIITF